MKIILSLTNVIFSPKPQDIDVFLGSKWRTQTPQLVESYMVERECGIWNIAANHLWVRILFKLVSLKRFTSSVRFNLPSWMNLSMVFFMYTHYFIFFEIICSFLKEKKL